ncbi:MAG: hypothetical protein ACJ8LG_14200 [Massilia sp.]
MSTKQKGQADNKPRNVSKEKTIPVAPGSLAAKRANAAIAGDNRQSGAAGAASGVGGGSQQGGQAGSGDGVWTPGSQQGGWSSRQKAQRMIARAEEDRLGEPQQSGYGGLEQKQHAGSQESVIGPPGSEQSGAADARQRQGAPDQPPSDSGSRRTKRNSSGSGQ